MKLVIVLYAYGVLKVVNPTPEQPIYLLVEPTCEAVDGEVFAYETHHPSDSDPGPEGYLVQGSTRCDVEQFVRGGP